MKKNNIADMFEAIGPTDAEKKQILTKLLENKTKRRISLRPLGLLAAALALFVIASAPFWGPWKAPNGDGGDVALGSQPSIGAAVSAPPKAATPGDDGLALVSVAQLLITKSEMNFEISSSYQDIIIVRDNRTPGYITVRQYDHPEAEPFAWVEKDGKFVGEATAGKWSDDISKNKVSNIARLEVAIPGDNTFQNTGEVLLSSAFGDIMIAGDIEWDGSIRLSTTFGDITTDGLAVEKTLFVSTSFGDIRLGEVKGQSVDLQSEFGDITVTCINGMLNATSAFGDVILRDSIDRTIPFLPAISNPSPPALPSGSPNPSSSSSGNNMYTPASDEIVLRSEFSLSMDGIESVEVSSLYQKISVTVTDTKTITIRQYDFADAKELKYTSKSNSVTAECQINSYNGRGNIADPRIELELPKTFRGNVNLGSVSGNVTVRDGVHWGDVDLGSVSGNIKVDTMEAENVALGSVSGNVNANRINCVTYNIGTVSGSITLVEITGEGSAGTVSGIVRINGETQKNTWAPDFFDYSYDFDIDLKDLEDYLDGLEDYLESLEDLMAELEGLKKGWTFDWPDDMSKWIPDISSFTLPDYQFDYSDFGAMIDDLLGVYIIGEVISAENKWILVKDEWGGYHNINISKATIYPEGRQIKEGDCVFLRADSYNTAYCVNVARKK
ncbi:MAG: DUF4097 domain-containing protein [Oscillospiraceae bacterium]|nr:DUF4097 domain-containing protein [Oscillospiraceae bacterium]